MPFELVSKIEDGPILLKSTRFVDNRGYFFENYKKSAFSDLGITEDFVQDNVSYSVKNVLRGMHFQSKPKAQGKLVACIKGEVFDAVVCIDKESPVYKKTYTYTLSENNGLLLYIPVGYAHGFLAKSDDSIFLYKTTDEYSPSHDAGFIWNDPEINIPWEVENPIMSEKDKVFPFFKDLP